MKTCTRKKKHVCERLAGLEFLDPLAHLLGLYKPPLSVPFALLQTSLLELPGLVSYLYLRPSLVRICIIILFTLDVKNLLQGSIDYARLSAATLGAL